MIVVGALVVRRSLEILVVGLGIGALFVCSWSFVTIVRLNRDPSAGLWALLLAVAGVIGGYVLGSGLIDAVLHWRPTETRSELGGPTSDGLSVIVTACTDAETYSPERTKHDLDELTAQSVLESGLGLTPFLYAASKARFRAIGGRNPGPSQLASVAERLERHLEAELGTSAAGQVTWTDCSDASLLRHAVLSAAAGGAGTIVIAPYAAGSSVAFAAAVREIDSLHLDDKGYTLVVAPTLEGADEIATMLVQRVLDVAGARDETGVALVAHGLPEQLDQVGREYDQQELAFVNRVRLLLTDAGIPESNVRVAWSEWRQPDLAETIQHLAALGCERVVVVPAVFAVDSLATLLDMVHSARQVESAANVSTLVLPPWRDDPQAVDALVGSVRSALADASRMSVKEPS